MSQLYMFTWVPCELFERKNKSLDHPAFFHYLEKIKKEARKYPRGKSRRKAGKQFYEAPITALPMSGGLLSRKTALRCSFIYRL